MSNYAGYLESITKLLLSSGLAQIITIVTTITCARLYSPENFAYFGIYVATISILLTFSTGRLDLALIQVSSLKEYKKILISSITILLTSAAIFFAITQFMYNFNFNQEILLLIFFGLIANGICQIYSNLFSSQQRYLEIGLSRIFAAVLFAIFAISFPFLNIKISLGLILASLFSQAMCAIMLIVLSKVPLSYKFIKYFKSVIIEYKDYWTLDTFSSLLNTFGRQLPLIIFPTLFGPLVAGYYFFCQRIVAAPVNLIANSVGNVFRKDATKEFIENGNFLKIFIFSLTRLFFISIIGVIIVFIVVDENLLIFLFGDEWSGILNILKMVIIFYAFKFVISPLTYSLYIVRKLHWNLYGQFFYLSCLFTPILVGSYLGYSPEYIIGLHVLGACVAYLVYLSMSYYCAIKGSKI